MHVTPSRRSNGRPGAKRPGRLRAGLVGVAVLAGTTAVACGPPPTIETLAGDDVSADNMHDCPMGELDKATGVTNLLMAIRESLTFITRMGSFTTTSNPPIMG